MFKNYFKKNIQADNNLICGINISISKDGSVVTNLLWPDLDNFSNDQIYLLAIEYVTVLCEIINGNIRENIYDALKTVKPGTKDYRFASYIYNAIDNLEISKNSMSNEIVVKPKNVFKK